MATIFEVKLEGGERLDRALYQMDRRIARNLIQRAVRHALKPVMERIRLRIKGELSVMNAQARAIYSKQIGTSVKGARGGVIGRVRTRSTKAKTKKGIRNFAPLAHLFEGGVKPHLIVQPKMNRVLKHPGVKGDPLWAESFDQMREKMVRDYQDMLIDNLMSAWK